MKDHAVKEKLLKRLSLNKQRLELNKASIVEGGGDWWNTINPETKHHRIGRVADDGFLNPKRIKKP